MQRIEFHSEVDFILQDAQRIKQWIIDVIRSEEAIPGELDFIFCDDNYLQEMHIKFKKDDSFTDILTFDYCENGIISGDIFISVDRVRENAKEYGVGFEEELNRVIIHGVLHLIGYGDSDRGEIATMRQKEEEKLKMFHVEQ